MKFERWGSRGCLVTFEVGDTPFAFPTSVYLIEGEQEVLVCDTHCGIDSMKPIQCYIEESCGGKPVMIVNTHHDFDHVWGNGAWPGARILSHHRCYELLAEDAIWEHFLEEFKEAVHGEVHRCLPSMTFVHRLGLPQFQVELVHTPGHTEDCISVYDRQDGVIFVGDNLEAPIPYLQSHRLDLYLESLAWYEKHPDAILLTSHTAVADRVLLASTRKYIEDVRVGREPGFVDSGLKERHETNLQMVLLSRLEAEAREELGVGFALELWLQEMAPVSGRSFAAYQAMAEAFVHHHR